MGDNLDDIQKDIQQFLGILEIVEDSDQYAIFHSLSKSTLFFKFIVDLGDNAHYPQYMIYDMLMVVYLLTKDSRREVYNTYRSLIENFIRYELNLKDTDDTGVFKLFKNFRKQYEDVNTSAILNFVEAEYGICCNYVHSNIKANVQLLEYLADIVQNPKMDSADKMKLLKEIEGFFNQIVTFCCYKNSESIGRAFFKKNQMLLFLIGEKNYQISRKDIDL